MPDELLSLTPDPLDAAAVLRLVEDASPPGRHGAVAAFVGSVRDGRRGRRVIALEYEAYEPLALETFRAIAAEAASAWPEALLAIRQRVGRVGAGEASIVIAAASPHRAEAFAACRYAIERVKQVAPIWKRELVEGGASWVEGATADPFDDAARDAAMRRACG